MSLPLVNAKKQYVDFNGNPLAGGSVAYYIPGTFTPVNTYQDQALTIANSNPVILDANGQAVVWVADATSVREVVKDAQGNQIWDQVTATGLASVTFTQAGTGAVSRPAQSKMQDWISIKDFGAKGDGTTDDYAAFSQHLADYPTGQLYIPTGTYVIGSSITLTQGIQFAPGAMIQPKAGAIVSIAGTIDAGDNQVFSSAAGGQIQLQSKSRFTLAAWFGISTFNNAAANTNAFNFMMASMPSGAGFHVMWPAGNINVNNCKINNVSNYIMEGHGDGTWIINNTTNQFALESTGVGTAFNVKFRNLRFSQASGVTPVSGNGGLHIQSVYSEITNCEVNSYPAALYDGFFIDGATGIKLQTSSVFSCLNNGWHFGGGCGDVFAYALYSNSNGQNGYYFNGISGLYGFALNGFGNNNSCFYFDNTGHVNGSGSISEFIFGVGWIADTSGNNNWNILDMRASSFSDCWGCTQKVTTTNPFAVGFQLSGSNVFEISMANCIALTNNGNGFFVDNGAADIQMTGCIARGNGLSASGAAATNGFYMGLGGAITNISMVACRSKGHAGYGINFGGVASDYCNVSSCNTRGNTTGGILNNATGIHNNFGTGANA